MLQLMHLNSGHHVIEDVSILILHLFLLFAPHDLHRRSKNVLGKYCSLGYLNILVKIIIIKKKGHKGHSKRRISDSLKATGTLY